jgi:hypothetical protein
MFAKIMMITKTKTILSDFFYLFMGILRRKYRNRVSSFCPNLEKGR